MPKQRIFDLLDEYDGGGFSNLSPRELAPTNNFGEGSTHTRISKSSPRHSLRRRLANMKLTSQSRVGSVVEICPQNTKVNGEQQQGAICPMYNPQQCTFCRQGGLIVNCNNCGKGMCIDEDGGGCLSLDPHNLPSDLRCPGCYESLMECPYTAPTVSRKAGVSGAGVAFLTITYDEDIFNTGASSLKSWFRLRYPGHHVPLIAENHSFQNLAGKDSKVKIAAIAERLNQFAVNHVNTKLCLVLGLHSRPKDGHLLHGSAFAPWIEIVTALESVLALGPLFRQSSMVLLTCGSTVKHALRALRATTLSLDLMMAFGANYLDPSIICMSFLPNFYEHFVLGFDTALDAAKKAFTNYIGRHTDVLLMESGRVTRLVSAPYSRPHGTPITCCGQEMEFRCVLNGKRKEVFVKLRCRLKDAHPAGESRCRVVSCGAPVPGTKEVFHKGGHRFLILYKDDDCPDPYHHPGFLHPLCTAPYIQ